MTADGLARLRQAAVQAGLLPARGGEGDSETGRPWPVLLLTALGAWLAVLPLGGVVGMLLGEFATRGVGPYLTGTLLLAAAAVLLRGSGVPLFIEQLALPALLVGGGTLGFGLGRDLPAQAACALLAAVALGLAWGLPRAWLRQLLGAAAAALATVACVPAGLGALASGGLFPVWLGLHSTLGLWLAALAWQRGLAHADGASLAATLESVAAGWLLAVLAGLAMFSGMTFLVGGAMGSGLAAELARDVAQGGAARLQAWLPRIGSLACALVALGLAWRAWPSLRHARAAAVGLVLAALALPMPALGGALLALAACAAGQRWRLAAAAALACGWIVGAFYYQLAWPLALKGGVLLAAAAVLAVLAWPGRGAPAAVTGTRPSGLAAASIALAALATLAVANVAIWQKERLIASGARVLVELAPVDPRSLAQGDYMQLAWRLPADTGMLGLDLAGGARPYAVGRREADGVLRLQRIAGAADPLAPGEVRMQLTPKAGRWTLVSDAWFFREGDGPRWQQARYGEFRVDADGHALLVGLADAQLQAIPIPP